MSVITAVKKGSRTRGLVEYLFGPGRHEEHSNQRIVAAWSAGWEGIECPDEVQRALLAAELDAPLETLRGLVGEQPPARHVYHVSISNHGEDRTLSDDEWAVVAHTMAGRLGFTETDTRAGVRWVAVHHGDASEGRDHIHLQATLVREDGRAVHLSNDYRVLREVAGEMRERFGLEVRTRDMGAGTPALSRVEVQRQSESRQESDRERLRRTVRACATAARSESEFLTMAGEHGVIVRPRWETGTGRTAVVGYSVARPSTPGSGEDLVWFGGGKLGRDLTLPALRQGWSPDPVAVAAWRAVDSGTPSRAATVVRPMRGAKATTVGARAGAGSGVGVGRQEVAARAVAAVREQLRAVPVGDTRAWSAAARDGAGVLAATAEGLTGGVRGRVGLASHALARATQKEPGVHVRRPVGEGRLSLAARTVLTVTAASSDEVGTAVLLTQMLRLAESIRDAHAQAGRLVLARAAAEAAERNVAALARVGGPRELTATTVTGVVGAHALAVEQANRASGQRITPGLKTTGDQPVPRTRKDTDRGMER